MRSTPTGTALGPALSRQMTALYKNHSPLNIKGKTFSIFFDVAFIIS